jgi:hypothetical protein
MEELSPPSQISMYVLLAFMGLVGLLIWAWQVMILRGKVFNNPDGSTDDWHDQKTHYGIAFADVFVACPANLIGIALVFVYPRWAYYLLAMVSFWWVWANVMTTAISFAPYRHDIILRVFAHLGGYKIWCVKSWIEHSAPPPPSNPISNEVC